MLWLWAYMFPLFVSLVSLISGLFFVNSSYLVCWDITIYREVNYMVVVLVDSFSLIFLFTVGLVSSFVLFYSNYYMVGSLHKKKFILTLVVFIISMFCLSLSGDLFWVMIGWDGLGFSSMCLIFFFHNWKSFNSSMVTFISNRIGDFFIISFFCFFLMMNGSLFYLNEHSVFYLSLMLCFGAFSKSAQVPFSAWLPLAMAAPTPVSSLVHSSTLVTAGVFLLIRFNSLLDKKVFSFIFFISFLTIFLAGMSSIMEFDLKKIIALSTLSHIGLMMMFIGMESFISAKIHLVIHAFFKSLLFMISGLIIHDNNNFQDIRFVSICSKNEYISFSFLLSTLSMMGAPFFSGFFSKEVLLGWVFEKMDSVVYLLLFFFSVSLTCSYSIRLLFYFFFPSFPLISMSYDSGFLSKAFFVMSLISSFLSGVVIFSIIGKESNFVISSFSLFQKWSLLISISTGLILGLVFSFFYSFFSSKLISVCHGMWMIESMNYVGQSMVFGTSFFMMMKADVKGLLDFFFFFFLKFSDLISKKMKGVLFGDPFFFIKVVSFLMMVLFFFSIGSWKCAEFSVQECNYSLHGKVMKFKFGFHPFHVVDLSPWPLLMSLSVFSLVLNLYHYLNCSGEMVWVVEGVISSVLICYVWWRDVVRESTFQGNHTEEVQSGLEFGVILFICSEVMFFFSFFFGFLFSSLCPEVEIGGTWPPLGVEPLSFMMVPLLNTLILLSSGVSITWSHHGLLEGDYVNSLIGLVFTVFLGLVFSFFQYEEYYSCSFTMADSVYGSFFFLMTGFHGIHVMVGVFFISVGFVRLMGGHFSSGHHFGFEAAAWYWHFVDVVWLFLFITVYWWGS